MSLLRRIFLPVDVASPRDLAERAIMLVVGVFGYGFAISLMIRGEIGVSPWDVLSLGIIEHLPIAFGTVTIGISILVLLLWIPLRQRIGVGTVVNAMLVGPSADVGLMVLPELHHLGLQVASFAAGLLLLALVTGVYIAAGFGPGPRDGLMTGLVRVTGWKVWIVRTILEGSVLVIGWLLGGPVGLGTVAFAFGVGPLIGVFLPRIMRARMRRTEAHARRRASAAARTSTT